MYINFVVYESLQENIFNTMGASGKGKGSDPREPQPAGGENVEVGTDFREN